MPPRFSIRPLARQLTASTPQSKAPISTTTTKASALQNLGSVPNAASTLLNTLDSKPPPPATTTLAAGGASALSAQLDGAKYGNRNGWQRITDRTNVLRGTQASQERQALASQMPRKWKGGDVYAPHDLSKQQMLMWKTPRQASKDVFDVLGLNPLDHYKNFSMMSEYMTEQGRIKHSNRTGLRPVNQRKMAKAIRRAIGMGIHPSTHHHPEILYSEKHTGPRYQNAAPAVADDKKFKIK